MGVGLALRKLDQALKEHRARSSGRLVMLGPIIHNPQVMNTYMQQGVVLAHSLDAVQPGDTVIIRAHGVPREDEARLLDLGAHVLDATCPKVKQAQLAIDEATRQGTSLYLFGEAEHPEVQGLVSYANGPCLVFGSLKELKEKQTFKDTHNVVLAAQTTQEREEFEAIKKTLAEGHSLSVLETICDATRRRQQEALMISQQAEAMIVVGGKTSGNTRRLADVAESCGIAVWHIEVPEELPLEALKPYGFIGLTAGASTFESFGRAAQRRPPAAEYKSSILPTGLGAHRGTHAFRGFQTITHFQGHLFQRRHIAGSLHDVHECLGTELRAGVIGIHFTQKGRIGLPDSLRDSLSTDRAFENEIMNGGDKIVRHGFLLHKAYV